jgi:hypothetical protein
MPRRSSWITCGSINADSPAQRMRSVATSTSSSAGLTGLRYGLIRAIRSCSYVGSDSIGPTKCEWWRRLASNLSHWVSLRSGGLSSSRGWRWSEHVRPIVGTDSCQVHHIGYVISGHLHVEMTDGASIDLIAGDTFEIPPGHDAWVVGDEPWISVDYAGRRLFAVSPKADSDRVLQTVVSLTFRALRRSSGE